MTTFFSKLRRNPIGFLAALSYFTLVTHGAPSGSAASVHLARDESHPVGALYFMTNDPTENSVVAGQILADGSVIFSNTSIYHTGQKGSRVNMTDGPDALKSQGAVAVSQSAQLVAAVNAGSRTLSVFSIPDPSVPWNITLVNKDLGSYAGFPVSIAFNKNGTKAYVLNAGDNACVTVYNVTQGQGLTVIPDSSHNISTGWDQKDPPTLSMGMPNEIILTEDETQLLVSVSGVSQDQPGFLTGWYLQDGLLSNGMPHMHPANPAYTVSSFLQIPENNAVVALDPSYGLEIIDFTSPDFYRDSFNVISRSMNNNSPTRLAMSSKTNEFYIIDTDVKGNRVINVTIHLPNPPSELPMTSFELCQSCALLDPAIADVNGTEYLYVLDGMNNAIVGARLDDLGTVLGPFNTSAVGIAQNNNTQGLAVFISP